MMKNQSDHSIMVIAVSYWKIWTARRAAIFEQEALITSNVLHRSHWVIHNNGFSPPPSVPTPNHPCLSIVDPNGVTNIHIDGALRKGKATLIWFYCPKA